MQRGYLWFAAGVLLLISLPVKSAAPVGGSRYEGADKLARKIDQQLETAWKNAKIVPAGSADDAEWLRRVYLDLVGRIPTVREVRTFLADKRKDRRAQLVEQLLGSPRFVTHFSTVYRNLLLPEANANFQVRFQLGAFEGWLQRWLESGKGYDVMTRELLTAPINAGRQALTFGGDTTPAAFYAGKEFKAEEIAAAASRVFLGVNLGCAQCHNHPFASWKKEQFWSFAAFFSGIRTRRTGDFIAAESEKENLHEITIPGTEKVVKARYLDGKEASVKPGEKARVVLADWMTAKNNPYFARATVNRMWGHFFGTGLIDPLDEMVGTDNVATHPALLDSLAKGFIDSNYDLRRLIRTITATRAYQLTSRRTHPTQDDPQMFARMPLRGLTPEQLFDSLATATGYQLGGPDIPFAFGNNSPRSEFLNKFNNSSDRPTETQRSILQALTLMNGRVMTSATGLKTSETLAAVADAPFMSVSEKIEALSLAALSRKPTTKEMSRWSAYVSKAGEEKAGEALADIFWVLLNTSEFSLNH